MARFPSSISLSPAPTPVRVTVMFSALKEGVFEPTVAIEYTDNEIGFGAEGQGGGRVVREEVRDRYMARTKNSTITMIRRGNTLKKKSVITAWRKLLRLLLSNHLEAKYLSACREESQHFSCCNLNLANRIVHTAVNMIAHC